MDPFRDGPIQEQVMMRLVGWFLSVSGPLLQRRRGFTLVIPTPPKRGDAGECGGRLNEQHAWAQPVPWKTRFLFRSCCTYIHPFYLVLRKSHQELVSLFSSIPINQTTRHNQKLALVAHYHRGTANGGIIPTRYHPIQSILVVAQQATCKAGPV